MEESGESITHYFGVPALVAGILALSLVAMLLFIALSLPYSECDIGPCNFTHFQMIESDALEWLCFCYPSIGIGAIVLGIINVSKPNKNKRFGLIGLSLGIISIIIYCCLSATIGSMGLFP